MADDCLRARLLFADEVGRAAGGAARRHDAGGRRHAGAADQDRADPRRRLRRQLLGHHLGRRGAGDGAPEVLD